MNERHFFPDAELTTRIRRLRQRISVLPYYTSILVLPLTGLEIGQRLRQRTKPLAEYPSPPPSANDAYLFNGWVRKDSFRLSRRIRHAENFLPLIVGRIEPTSKGSILFVRYQMFPGSLLVMGFFGLLLILAALFFLFVQDNWLNALLLLLIALGIYVISVLDFIQKMKVSQQLLEKVLHE